MLARHLAHHAGKVDEVVVEVGGVADAGRLTFAAGALQPEEAERRHRRQGQAPHDDLGIGLHVRLPRHRVGETVADEGGAELLVEVVGAVVVVEVGGKAGEDRPLGEALREQAAVEEAREREGARLARVVGDLELDLVGAGAERQVGEVIVAGAQAHALHHRAVDDDLHVGRALDAERALARGARVLAGTQLARRLLDADTEYVGRALERRAEHLRVARLHAHRIFGDVVDDARAAPLEAGALLGGACRADGAVGRVDVAVERHLVLDHHVVEAHGALEVEVRAGAPIAEPAERIGCAPVVLRAGDDVEIGGEERRLHRVGAYHRR